MDKVRMGIIGLGNMGQFHAGNLLEGKVKDCELTAVSDMVDASLQKFSRVHTYREGSDLIHSGNVDAVIIATPHFFHTTLGIEALGAGLHVLVEKPVSVHKKDAQRLIAAHTDKSLVFSGMFNQRTHPIFMKVKELIGNGELGEIVRVNWTITDWFRTEAYYSNGKWRATWKGEGGGVLLNQCPHQLDLLQWMFGMPARVRGFAHLGARHHIEVEDQVTAYLEWPNRATGVFITSTGETPGTNRLEIAAEKGQVIVENDKLTFIQNEVAMGEFAKTARGGFDKPATKNIQMEIGKNDEQHLTVIRNFVNAVLKGEKLLTPAEEGIHSVELANAILFSALEERPVHLPLDADAYAKKLESLIAISNYDKKAEVEQRVESNMAKSF